MKHEPPGLTALVTGASSGLGESIAGELSSRGHTCLLVSENDGELERVKNEILNRGKGEVITLTLDLSRPDSADRLHRFCDSKGIVVDILINSAGIYLPIEREMNDLPAIETIINLHVLTLTKLCFIFGRSMLERKRGWILNVSSIASEFPDPASLTYGPTKRYVLALSQSLHCDWKDRNVSVTCLTPGGIDTNFFRANSVFIPPIIRRTLISSSDCARASIAAMFRGRARVTPGFSGKLQSLLLRFISRPLTYPIIRRSYFSMKKAEADD